MDLDPYVDRLHRELAVAAATGGPEARALAERLTAPLDSAVRLVLLESLAAAAGDITRDLAPGSVEVRLRGRDPEFHVTPPPAPDPVEVPTDAPPRTSDAAPAPAESDADEGATSRVTLRLPEHLKTRVESAAARSGLSVNTWLVRTVGGALDTGDGRTHGHLHGHTPGDNPSPSGRDGARPVASSGTRHTGWVR